MKYKETNSIEIDKNGNIETPVPAENLNNPYDNLVEDPKTSLDVDLRDALVNLLGIFTTTKHAHLKCKKTLGTLTTICNHIIFTLDVYCPSFEYPEIPAVKQESLEVEDLLSMYENLLEKINEVSDLAVKKKNYLILIRMQYSIDEIGKAMICLRQHAE